jgi:hypothetical protein
MPQSFELKCCGRGKWETGACLPAQLTSLRTCFLCVLDISQELEDEFQGGANILLTAHGDTLSIMQVGGQDMTAQAGGRRALSHLHCTQRGEAVHVPVIHAVICLRVVWLSLTKTACLMLLV